MLTQIQRQIVEAPLESALVTAGAGSGKTRVLTHRISHILDLGIPDWSIVALTFTNKAAKEMRERVEKMRGEHLGSFLGTFHSFAVRLLRKNIESMGEGYSRDFSIYDTDDKLKVLKEITGDKEVAKNVAFHLGNMKNEGMSVGEYDEDEEILQAMRAYEVKMRKSNALDFDDLLVKTVELFEKCPDVLEKLQNRFKFILVDEFQDTNYVQYKIVQKLAKSANIPVMVVGDEDQCIYTWRGASIDNLKKFKSDFSPTIFKLEQNFRSARNIVNLANTLIQNNTNRIIKNLYSELEDGNIELKQYYDEREEAQMIIQKIIDGKREGYTYSDFAILVRINSLSRVFEEQLIRNGIPYVIWGGFKFYERAEVKLALSYLKHMINPNDEVALRDALSLPKRGIGEVAFEKIRRGEIDYLTGKAKVGYIEFLEVVQKLKSTYQDNGLEVMAQEFLKITRVDRAFATGKEEDDRRIDNLFELMGAIEQFANVNPEATLSEYLQTVSINVGEADAQGERVVLSTIHSAKGLEFKNLFIVGLEDGILPLKKRDKFNHLEGAKFHSKIEEERRLLYVAITRAMDKLNLSFVTSRFFRGERQFQMPSRFIEELDIEPTVSRATTDRPYTNEASTKWGIKQWW